MFLISKVANSQPKNSLRAPKSPFAKREIFKNILRKFRRSAQQRAERSKGADKSAGEDSSVILMDTTKPDPAFEPTLLPDEDNMKLSTPSSEYPGTEVDLDSPITALMAVFGKSPLEIRTVISEHLLVVSEPIKDADKLMDLKSIEKTEIPHIGIANARILYTCRAIYEETLPFLYTRNTFLFRSPKRITNHGIEGGDEILGPPSRFGLRGALRMGD
ncbi:hypothetical protein OEA41_001033 [Lepraria neglecta]|uniref:Uncharacterized protein n=1 Tax=Lepraria neglecta TaxID=209136 RepID=A0AAD9ZI81_9LECA|nr:hypothetical protein OEA41_001033 [Lepraria neglecta]